MHITIRTAWGSGKKSSECWDWRKALCRSLTLQQCKSLHDMNVHWASEDIWLDVYQELDADGGSSTASTYEAGNHPGLRNKERKDKWIHDIKCEFERLIYWSTGWYQRALTAEITAVEQDRWMPPDSPQHSLWTALSTSIQPAVLGLFHQHSDHLPLGESQQIGFRAARLVGHPSPHSSSFQRLWWRASDASQGWRCWREDKWNRVQREQSVTEQVSW